MHFLMREVPLYRTGPPGPSAPAVEALTPCSPDVTPLGP